MGKVCILQNSMTVGGTDTFVINLCHGLNNDGYDVLVILSIGVNTVTERESELLATGVRVAKITSPQGGKSKFKQLKELYTLLRKEKPDVFQTNIDLFNGPQMFVAWLAGVPIRECHSHNSQQGRELREGKRLAVSAYQVIMRWLCWTFSNRRAGCSGIAMDFLFGTRWKNDRKSKVVHNGIDLTEYQIPLNIDNKKEKLGLKNKHNICTVGRISYQKNPLFIVEVMNELLQLRDDCDFVWVGTGDMEKEVQEKIQEYGLQDRMHLLGSRTDVPEILRSSDVFFLPSLFEGLAIVLIEAQAAGLPCVTATTTPPESNCGALIYIPLERPAIYWAQQISDILDGKIELQVDQKRLNEYSIDHMVSEMEGLFEL